MLITIYYTHFSNSVALSEAKTYNVASIALIPQCRKDFMLTTPNTSKATHIRMLYNGFCSVQPVPILVPDIIAPTNTLIRSTDNPIVNFSESVESTQLKEFTSQSSESIESARFKELKKSHSDSTILWLIGYLTFSSVFFYNLIHNVGVALVCVVPAVYWAFRVKKDANYMASLPTFWEGAATSAFHSIFMVLCILVLTIIIQFLF